MTLSLYTLHVVVLAATSGASDGWGPVTEWSVHAVTALVLASLWALTGRRGPLEHVIAEISRPGAPATSDR